MENMNTKKHHNRFSKSAVWTVLVILIILTIISATLLTIRLVNYIKVDDREVLLYSDLEKGIDLFSVKYKNSSGEVTVEGLDGQKVVAPGTAVEYTIRLRNKDKIAIDYEMIPDIKCTTEHILPIVVRMLDYDGNYIVGDAKTWVAIDEIGDLSEKRTLVKGESVEYVFEWKWEFESGNDEYDTFLGNISGIENVGIAVAFQLYAEANTVIGTNGGFMKSGLGDIVFAGLAFILLIIAIILLVLAIVKYKKNKALEVPQEEEEKVDILE